MSHLKFSKNVLEKFCKDAFGKFGFSVEESSIITDVLITADMYGIESHGMQRLSRYHKGIESGRIHPDGRLEIVFETPVSAVFDGHNGMGQLISYRAMETAIKKAHQTGVAFVSVRNSNHYGIAGYYAQMAAKEGLIGISCTNSEAIMVPTFSRQAMLGSNPVAMAVPAEPYPFLYDASTTVVTRGKLEMYRKAEKPLPDGWALNSNGLPTNDAEDVLQNIIHRKGGGIVPLGGSEEHSGSHKGYGYGMMCEIFSSILSLGLTSNHTNIGEIGGTCHGFAAIDPSIFGNPQESREHFSAFLQELREAPKASGQERIYTHGEKEALAYERHLKEPIPVDIKTVIEMKQMSDYLEMRFEDYFGNIELDVNNYHSVYKAIEKRSLKERSMYSEKSKTRIPGRLFVGRCNRG